MFEWKRKLGRNLLFREIFLILFSYKLVYIFQQMQTSVDTV